MKTPREILEDASFQVDTYKHPDISDARDLLDKILMAGGIGSVGGDKVRYIRFYNDVVRVGTAYSVRSCAQTADFKFPTSVIDSPDPVKAIQKWKREEDIKDLTNKRNEAKRQYEFYKKKLAEIRKAGRAEEV